MSLDRLYQVSTVVSVVITTEYFKPTGGKYEFICNGGDKLLEPTLVTLKGFLVGVYVPLESRLTERLNLLKDGWQALELENVLWLHTYSEKELVRKGWVFYQ